VVRDATGQIWVVFPGGIQSPATIMRVDRDWDLAALLIWKPNIQPLPVSTQAPQLGERLTIGGYGSGWYRAVSGVCLEYFSPGGNLPAEIVELSVPARNGDSGGPIFNDRGEIAGVLFGSDRSSTMGSYCGRLRQFLAPLAVPFAHLPAPPATMIAGQNSNLCPIRPVAQQLAVERPQINYVAITPNRPATNPQAKDHRATEAAAMETVPPAAPPNASAVPANMTQGAIGASAQYATTTPSTQSTPPVASPGKTRKAEPSPAVSTAAVPVATLTTSPNPPVAVTSAAIPVAAPANDVFSHLKNFLAIIGILALFIQVLKILGKTAA
jgi:hypothetical protein